MTSAPESSPSSSPSSDAGEAGPPFDGDPAWWVERSLPEGLAIVVRGVVPEDREEVRRGFRALSAETRRLRFLENASDLTEEALTYLTSVDQKDHVALGAVLVSPDLKSERGIGIARFVRLKDRPDTAEAAVTVADDMQRRGVGTILMRELLRAAEARGIRTIRAEVLADNATMRGMLDSVGAKPIDAESGEGTIAYDLDLSRPRSGFLDLLRAAAQTMAVRVRWPT